MTSSKNLSAGQNANKPTKSKFSFETKKTFLFEVYNDMIVYVIADDGQIRICWCGKDIHQTLLMTLD